MVWLRIVPELRLTQRRPWFRTRDSRQRVTCAPGALTRRVPRVMPRRALPLLLLAARLHLCTPTGEGVSGFPVPAQPNDTAVWELVWDMGPVWGREGPA